MAPELCENFKMPQMSMHRKSQFCLAFWVFLALLGERRGTSHVQSSRIRLIVRFLSFVRYYVVEVLKNKLHLWFQIIKKAISWAMGQKTVGINGVNSLRKSGVPNLRANVNAFSNLKETSHLEFRDSLSPVASGAVSPTWLTYINQQKSCALVT